MSWFKIELNNDTEIFFFSLNGMLTTTVTVLFTFRHSDSLYLGLSVANGCHSPVCQANGEAQISVPFLKSRMNT